MNQRHCEREPEIVEALHTGAWREDLRRHADSCRACAETRFLAQSLLQTAARMALHTPPDASQVWRKAREEAREVTLKRASRLFNLMRTAGLAYGLVLAAWCVHGFLLHGVKQFLPSANGVTAGTATIGALVAFACIVMGIWYTVCSDRDTLLRSAGR
ncbi:MAG: hypothetical protein P4K86_00930 [Terracidiphilus sp.]|nr:hypothetical protein [Terracidiphilus sp.]MDR3775950.1 hypothetical protein [Terracidiphilus sp.]